MKKNSFYLFFIFLFFKIADAQTTNWELALSQISTPSNGFSSQKILLDKVTSFANLYNYNEPEHNKSNANHFKQSLSELYRASEKQYFANQSIYPDFDKIASTATMIPIGIINTKCTYLNYDEDNNVNGNLQLINGIYQPIKYTEPNFIEKNLCIISPLFPAFVSENDNFTFNFDSQQFYEYGNTIKKLEVDFGDGLWRTVINDGIMVQNIHSVNLGITALKKQIINFKITQQSGIQVNTYAEITLSKKTSNNGLSRAGSCGISPLLKFRSTIADSENIKGEIEYKIFYSNSNTSCIIKKPIIIVDGFDPEDKRRIDFEDCQNDIRCSDQIPTPTKDNYKSLSKLMEYNGGQSLISLMNNENYDVILVNFPFYRKNENDSNSELICAGADDIIRNGNTIASFIQKINQDLISNSSNEKLVVIGPSMGGLITRYALAYLEKQGIPHNTKIWLSMDSPHQGANIPLAIQQDIYFLGNKLKKEKAEKQFNNLLHSKAAEQLLIDIVDYNGNCVRNATNANFMNTIKSNGIANSNGYPVLGGIRKIAISNGSFAGKNNVTPKENFFHIKASVKIKLVYIRVGRKRIFRLNNFYTPNNGENITLVENQGRNPDKGIENTNYPIYYTGYNPNGSMDAVPGGNFNPAEDLKNEINSELEKTNAWSNLFYLFLWTDGDLIIDRVIPSDKDTVLAPQAFIPTHSSLDTKNFPNWYQPINKNIVCTGQTPFDSYYGEENNSEHISFTDSMVKWIQQEIKDNPQPPSFPIQADAIAGPNTVCVNTAANFNFPDVCKIPGAATWKVSSNLQIVYSTGYSVAVKGLANSASGSITATFQNGQTFTKTVWVGVPLFPAKGLVVGATNVTFNQTQTYYYNGNNPSGGGNYQWFIDAPINDAGGPTCGWQILSGQGTSSITVKTGCIPTTAVVGIKSINICGASSSKYLYVTNSATGNGNNGNGDPCSGALTVYPNPISSKDNLNMKVIYPPDPCGNTKRAYQKTAVNKNNTVRIYDFNGNLVYNNQFNSDEISISDLNLKKGHYMINVANANEKILKKIIIIQ
jgi:hypothetical protein